MKDLVVGIDSSTQSTKAIAWTKTGEFVAEGRCPIDLLNPVLANSNSFDKNDVVINYVTNDSNNPLLDNTCMSRAYQNNR